MRINWSEVDPLIIKYLPKMTCVEFCEKYPYTISRTIGTRAKKLGIVPKKYKPTDAHKKATGAGIKKSLPSGSYEYVKLWLNKKPRKDIAKELNISLYQVNNIVKELGLVIDDEKYKEFVAERSKKHIHLATKASCKRWEDPLFRTKMSDAISERSKKLWQDEEYRLKVRNGIRKTYDSTDLRYRLSVINKKKYKNDPKVREILSADRPSKTSKLNDTVAVKLDSFEIPYNREFGVANYKFDFKIGNILLEVNGDYWHKLPGNIKNDRAKATIIEKYYPQYKLRSIWESEVKSIRCNERILELLEIQIPEPQHVDLDKIDIVEDIDTRRFLISFHYIGDTNRIKHTYGLTLHGEVIAVAVFGPPVRMNTAPGKVVELVRLCRHPRFHNKNMMSFFLSRCIKKIKKLDKYDNIVSFSDLRYHDGATYKATNWKDYGETSSDYNYMSEDNIPMHKKTLYNRAKAAGMREREYAEANSYQKVKIGSKRKFIIQLRQV